MQYRTEIDGLRTVAVVPVILFHAGFEMFSGGFVGVDIFFVISGYLITSIIVSDLEQGKFKLINFYDRRARRILPALFFVLFACLPFAWIWLLPNDMEDFAKSLMAVSSFSSNILFWRETGYFSTASELIPLLHTWSLAVEEQYYIFFPLFMMFTWRFGLRFVLGLICLVFVFSLELGHWGALNKPDAAFFLLPTRAWELLVGVFAAFYLRKLIYFHHSLNLHVHQVLSLLGLLMVLYSIFVFDERTPFPGLPALVPTVGAGLIILFASQGTLVNRLLSTKGFVGIGSISYSAYLWHNPLMVFVRHRSLTEPSQWLMGLLCIFTLILAYVSWRYVERPFRNKQAISRKFVFGASGVLIGVTFSIGIMGYLSQGIPERTDNDLALKVEGMINESPKLTDKCGKGFIDSEACRYGGDKPKILLWGDSYADHLVPALKSSKSIIPFTEQTLFACRPVLGISIFKHDKEWRDRCIEHNPEVFSFLKNTKSLKYVVLASPFSFNGTEYIDENGKVHDHNVQEIVKTLKMTIEEIIKSGLKPVIISPPPSATFNIGECIVKSIWLDRNTSQCEFDRDSLHESSEEAYKIMDEISDIAPIFELRSIICASEKCSVMWNDIPIYKDGGHLTKAASSYLGETFDLAGQIIQLAESFQYKNLAANAAIQNYTSEQNFNTRR